MKVYLPALRVGTGADVFTERLAQALRARGVAAEIGWFPAWMEAFPELMALRAPPPGTTVIHGNGWTVSPFVGGRLPVVDTVLHLVHDPAFAPYRSRAQALYHAAHVRWRDARAIRRADAVTAISPYVAGTVRALFGREDVAIIGVWVDVQRYRPAVEAMPRTPDAPLRVLWVGNPSRRKGADLLPLVAERLRDVAQIRCVGGLRGDDAPTHAGLHWLGRLDEDALVREYQQCDVVLSLSRYEGYGYTALEGMACGKPVVAFATSGLADVVQHGVTGLLAPLDDVDALTAHVRALRDPALRSALGGEGLAFARRQPDQVDAYVRLYAALRR